MLRGAHCLVGVLVILYVHDDDNDCLKGSINRLEFHKIHELFFLKERAMATAVDCFHKCLE